METFDFKDFNMELTKTNEKFETLFEAENCPVKITFYWDSHGKLVPFTGGPKNKATYSKTSAKVRIVAHTYTMLDKEWSDWSIYVNDELINCSVYRYKYTGKNLLIKGVVGWG